MSRKPGVLVAVDGSVQDQAALDWATEEAAALGTGLTVVQVREDPVELPRTRAEVGSGDGRAGQAVLEAVVGRVVERAADVPVRTSLVVGKPMLELLRLASMSDRVVLAESRTGRWFWSLAGQVAARTAGPAVVVRGRAKASGPVIAGLSGLGGEDATLREAFAYARRRGLPVRVLRTYGSAYLDPTGQLPPYSPRILGQEAVEAAVRPWARAYPDVLVECVALAGSPAYRLLEVSAGSGLLVVGSSRTGGPAAVLHRSLVRTLSRRSRCPVVVARR
jgi:nucleotide-binding universal stress UspA family protein